MTVFFLPRLLCLTGALSNRYLRLFGAALTVWNRNGQSGFNFSSYFTKYKIG